jgi:type II secretory pathway component PulK
VRKNKIIKKNKAYALILVVAVLAALMIIQIGLTIATNFESSYSYNQKDSTIAAYLAEAGLNKTIAELKAEAKSSFLWVDSDTSNNYYASYEDATLCSSKGKYTVTAADCSSRINLNDTGNPNLNQLLAYLPGISSLANANAIISYRNTLPGGVFETKEQLRQVSGITYDDVKDYVCIKSYVDHSTNRSPVNVNSADQTVLKAVFAHVLSDATKADTLAADIVTNKRANPFDDWNEFDSFIDSRGYLNATDISNLKINCNPNRDKTLITNATTELCFCAGGYFEVISTGVLYATPSQITEKGNKEIAAVIRTHDIVCDTSKSDFYRDLYTGGTGPAWQMVNWQDSCPVTSDYDEGLDLAANYKTIADSLKLGYWDNFDEDVEDAESWTQYNWRVEVGSLNVSLAGSTSNKMHGSGSSTSSFILDAPGSSIWRVDDNFSLRIHARDPVALPGNPGTWSNYEDAGSLEFIKSGNTYAKLWVNSFGFLWQPAGGGWAKFDITRCPPQSAPQTVAADSDVTPRQGKDFFDSQIKLSFMPVTGPIRDRFIYLSEKCYGISPCATDHYNNWIDDQGSDEYHGTIPTAMTYRLTVENTDYDVEVAVGNAWAYSYNYTTGAYISRTGYSPADNDYLAIPFETETANYFDRYGYWAAKHGGNNNWRPAINGWNLKLYSKSHQTNWDEIRIIVPDGQYESVGWSKSVPVYWAAINWTKTIPDTADVNNETISISVVDSDGDSTAVNLNQGLGNSILSPSLKYLAVFESTDPDLRQTPVLEDVSIIYILPVTEVIYWRDI